MSRLKILQINAVSGIRSTGRTCVEIADYLNENGHEGYVAYSDGIPYRLGYKIGTPIEIKIHGLLSRALGTQAYFSKNGTRKLIKYIKELQPDVVHLRNLHGNYINIKMLLTFLAQKDIPTVLTLHDCWFFTGKCCNYSVDNCFKWHTECSNCPRIHKDNPSWLFDRTKTMYKNKKEWFGKIPRLAVVGVSDWVTSEAQKSFLASAKILTRIYNWVDMDVFEPVNTDGLRHSLGLENKFIILGVASDWNNAKGLDKFIEIADAISIDMAIVLIGNIKGTQELPQNIIHLKETHDINELAAYYSMADVFLNLSLEETFGKVAAEALACGTPVICLRSTANPELVPDGCGYVIDEYSSQSILNSIDAVHAKGKSEYSSSCVSFANNNFEKDANIIKYLDLYQECLNCT